MKNTEDVLIILMKRIPAEIVLKRRLLYNSFSQQEFVKIASLYMTQYSETEIANLYDYLLDYVTEEFNRVAFRFSDRREINIFDMIVSIARNLLILSNNQVLCRYYKLMEWRNLTVNLSEDMFTCAFLAIEDGKTENRREDFFWDATVGHNNQMINRLMERKIAENHFHLWASAPYFNLLWAMMMNQVEDSYYKELFAMIDERKMHVNYNFDVRYHEMSAEMQYLQAMLIRAYLYAWLTDEKIELGTYKITWDELEESVDLTVRKDFETCMITVYNIGKVKGRIGEQADFAELLSDMNMSGSIGKRCIHEICGITLEEVEDFRDKYLPVKSTDTISLWEMIRVILRERSILLREAEMLMESACFEALWWKKTFYSVRGILSSQENLGTGKWEIQSVVTWLREENEGDYVQHQIHCRRGDSLETELLYCGERWFLYQMFRKIGQDSKSYREQYNWFYAYLIIKEQFRSEVMQTNDKIGLMNFERYYKRKNKFSLGIKGDMLAGLALKGTLKNQNIKYLEARIAPGGTAQENREYIRMLDEMITKEEKKRCYYVFHFKKEKDTTPVIEMDNLCRHYAKRQKLHREACALAAFRERYPLLAQRVLGIDACSYEIGCRPEVFAQAFRYLKNHTVEINAGGILSSIPQLKVTYHVGEDYLDMADGLRAIDEAIHFLGLDCGDRLGHALVLGTDAKQWYHNKNYHIILSKQDYLDNIVWMYGRLIEFKVSDMENLLHYLEAEFEYYFKEIYGNSIKTHGSDYTIFSYYYAQKLRGDDPECYREGRYVRPLLIFEEYDHYAVNHTVGEKKDYRKIPEAVWINHLYHYSGEVKQKGSGMIQKEVPFFWVKGIEELQNRMQWQVAMHGISVEVNPSSNVKIGGYQKYENLPIVRLYNHDLVTDQAKQQECAQISVSINTDDQGIFATSLENEYGLMACALELCCDEENNQVYDRIMIYKWLDKVREFGIMQVFKD